MSCGISSHDESKVAKYSSELAHAPSPLPDRVVLTWEDDPATTQSVTWRTDVSTKKGMAHLALANANGRALEIKYLLQKLLSSRAILMRLTTSR